VNRLHHDGRSLETQRVEEHRHFKVGIGAHSQRANYIQAVLSGMRGVVSSDCSLPEYYDCFPAPQVLVRLRAPYVTRLDSKPDPFEGATKIRKFSGIDVISLAEADLDQRGRRLLSGTR
jgi:hypothetical protein